MWLEGVALIGLYGIVTAGFLVGLTRSPVGSRTMSAGPKVSEVWPGDPYPLGAVWDGVGTNISVFSSAAEKVELCLFDADDVETRLVLPEIDGYCWHGYIPGMRPGTRYGFRVNGPYDPHSGVCAATRTSCCSTRTPKQSTARSSGTRPSTPTTWPAGTTPSATTRTRRPTCRRRSSPTAMFDWGRRPAAPHPVARDDRLRDPRQGPDRHPPGHSARAAGHLCRPGPPGHDRLLDQARGHRGRADAGPPVHPRPAAGRSRLAQLLGLQLHRLPGAAQRLRLPPGPRCGQRVQGHGPHAARRRHRGHPRRGVQPHRRRQPPGPHSVVPRP